MRTKLAALLSVRALPALSPPPVLARMPSRLLSTEKAANDSTAPKSQFAGFVDAMMPFATFIGIVTAVGGIGTLFHSRMTKLEADMAGTAATLKSDMAGIIKEVDAKNTGTKDAVTKEVDAKIAGFKEAADLKVRFLLRAREHAPPNLSLTCLPLPPAV